MENSCINGGSEQVIGCSDGMNVSGKVKVELCEKVQHLMVSITEAQGKGKGVNWTNNIFFLVIMLLIPFSVFIIESLTSTPSLKFSYHVILQGYKLSRNFAPQLLNHFSFLTQK